MNLLLGPLALLLLSADVRLEGGAAARLETRARTGGAGDLSSDVAADTQVTPMLQGAAENGTGRLSASYFPTFRLREPYNVRNPRPEMNHFQSFQAQWFKEARPRPYLFQSFGWGRVDLGAQRAQGAVPSATGFTALGTTSDMSVDATGGVQWPLTRNSSLDTGGGFSYASGLDARSTLFLPAQRVGRAFLRLDDQLTWVDHLQVALDGTYTVFPGRIAVNGLAQLATRWRRQLAAPTTIEAGLLLSAVYVVSPFFYPKGTSGELFQWDEDPPPDPMAPNAPIPPQIPPTASFSIVPGGEITYKTRLMQGIHLLEYDATVRLAPFLDRFLATAYYRADLVASLNYQFQGVWQAAARLQLGRGLDGVIQNQPAEIVTVFFEGRVGYVPSQYWRVEVLGVNSLFTSTSGVFNNWLLSVAFTVAAGGNF